KPQVIIFVVLSLISVFIHRPVNGASPLQSLDYYTPIYLLGILLSIYSDRVKNILKDKLLLLLFGFFLLSYLTIFYWAQW
ncbi:hypothetical protein, partial [Klebsiella pneumoniae]|uniref:hypothetical protein n=1 Tax=Klebsiella pneumoniae TaxID=573 RepID=UPI001C8F1FC5